MYRILVIAPDLELRRSLQFALEAEGYTVTSRASISATEMPVDFDCAVVDHHALGNDTGAGRTFVEAFQPVILLANAQHHFSASAFRTVLKPHLGLALTNAIRDALEARAMPK